MHYYSSRSHERSVTGAQAVIQGLAPDGGLYMPERIPEFDAEKCVKMNPYAMATALLGAFLPDIPEMEKLVLRAYSGKFAAQDLTPLVQAGDFSVLELFHGPTSAFKDVALSVLPQLLVAARKQQGMTRETMILTATSGDTGKAALEGFKDVDGVRICVFYPHGGVSAVQRAQMVTQEGSNVTVCAVEGNFDDAQTGVKEVFAACSGREDICLSSANSINIGRLIPQVMYYFKAYGDLLRAGSIRWGEEVNFSVPTGNFGDILAGYLAKRLGLPVGKLICASNANNVLTDFIRTGEYDRRRVLKKTQSPSMDILVSSNLERLLYLMSGENTALVAQLMEKLRREGVYTVPEDLAQQIRREFFGGWCDDSRAREVIGRVYKEKGYLCDPHTAAGWAVAEDYVNQTGDKRPMVVLSTASPFKFSGAVLEALGLPVPEDGFRQMDALSQATGLKIPENLGDLERKPERHTGVIGKNEMLEFVLRLNQ